MSKLQNPSRTSWKAQVSGEVELRTPAICAVPQQLEAATVLSGVSPNKPTPPQANRTVPNRKPRLEDVLSLTSEFLPSPLLLVCTTAAPNYSPALMQHRLSVSSKLQNSPEVLQKPRVSVETQLRTPTARPHQAALILSGVSNKPTPPAPTPTPQLTPSNRRP